MDQIHYLKCKHGFDKEINKRGTRRAAGGTGGAGGKNLSQDPNDYLD
jgi:hypothetical protein